MADSIWEMLASVFCLFFFLGKKCRWWNKYVHVAWTYTDWILDSFLTLNYGFSCLKQKFKGQKITKKRLFPWCISTCADWLRPDICKWRSPESTEVKAKKLSFKKKLVTEAIEEVARSVWGLAQTGTSGTILFSTKTREQGSLSFLFQWRLLLLDLLYHLTRDRYFFSFPLSRLPWLTFSLQHKLETG